MEIGGLSAALHPSLHFLQAQCPSLTPSSVEDLLLQPLLTLCTHFEETKQTLAEHIAFLPPTDPRMPLLAYPFQSVTSL